MMLRRHRTTMTAALTAASLFVLTGCAGAQSIAEACNAFAARHDDVRAQITDIVANIQDGTEIDAKNLSELNAIYADIDHTVSNETMQPLLDDLITAMAKFTDAARTLDLNTSEGARQFDTLANGDANPAAAEKAFVDTCNANLHNEPGDSR